MHEDAEESELPNKESHSREDVDALHDVLTLFTAPALQGHNRVTVNPIDEDRAIRSWFLSMVQRVKELEGSLRFEEKGPVLVIPCLMMLLKECLASQRWKEVVDILRPLALEYNNTDITLFKVGFEVMMSDTESNNGFLLQLVNQLKLLSEIEAKEITLEYLKHFLCQGKTQDAIQVLQSSQSFDKQRWMRIRMVTDRTTEAEVMLKAYQGLVWYVEWLQAKHKLHYIQQQAQDSFYEIQPSTSSMLNQEEIMKILAGKALSAFESLNNTPGVLDVFIIKQAELLEYYDRDEEARTVLSQYAEKNPENPNAHRYLYWLLKRTNADLEDQCQALQAYIRLVPSDALTLKLCQLKQSMGSGPSSVLPYIFDLLDYPSWTENFEAWEYLHQTLHTLFSGQNEDCITMIKKCWEIRSSWWPQYHFASENILTSTDDCKQANKDFLSYKAAAAVFLMGQDNDFSARVAELISESDISVIQEARRLMNSVDIT